MRVATFVIAFLLTMLIAISLARGQPPRIVDDVDARSLTAAEVETYAADYYPTIKGCYLQYGHVPGATGELALKLVVHRNGYVHDVKIDAPGVRGAPLRWLENCVRLHVLGWHFPVRKDFTTALLPYYFLYLDVPGAGPQYSCWNPKGCPPRAAKRHRH